MIAMEKNQAQENLRWLDTPYGTVRRIVVVAAHREEALTGRPLKLISGLNRLSHKPLDAELMSMRL